MTRRVGPPRLSRRDLIKSFGPLAFLLFPVARSMGYVAGGTFAGAPRFVHFFKGPSYHSPTVNPTKAITDLPAPLAALAPHAEDLVLFTGMSIHGGSPKTDGYQEEHAAGLIGCATGHSYHYSKDDSYYAYTDNESIDITIANHYQTIPALKALIAHYRQDPGWAKLRPPFVGLSPAETDKVIRTLAEAHGFKLDFAKAA